MTPQHSQLAARLARDMDAAIKATLDRCAGRGWSLESIDGRFQSTKVGQRQVFTWDSRVVMELGPVEFHEDRSHSPYVINASRSVTNYSPGRRHPEPTQ